MKKTKSILTDNMDKCYLCGSYSWIEIHHVFNGANRKASTEYGCVVPLCHYCHNEPPQGVHYNQENDIELKQVCQKKFEELYGHEKFMSVFHKNYL